MSQGKPLFEPKFKRFRKRLLIFSGASMAVFYVWLYFFVFSFSAFKDLDKSKTAAPSVVLTEDAKIIAEFTSDDDDAYVPLQELPLHLQNALLAAQDDDYLEDKGASWGGLVGGLFGRKVNSTLTQQLARIMLERQSGKSGNIWRKLRVALSTVSLEDRFTKQEIIGHYLNFATFVGSSTGIEAAATAYFDKKAKDLTPAESALLVGVLKAPTTYNPKRKPQKAVERRNEVLTKMRENGWLTENETKKWKAEPLALQRPAPKPPKQTVAPYFRDFARNWLKKWCAENGYDPYTDGLKVYATISSQIQKHAEDGVAKHLENHQALFDQYIGYAKPWKKDSSILYRAMRLSDRYRELKEQGQTDDQIRASFNVPVKMKLFSWNEPGYVEREISPWDSLIYYTGMLHTGVISIDPRNGHVRAYVGGINYDYFKYDHVTQGKRQVGSTFKPFVYATAFDKGIPPCSTYLNQPVTIIAPDGDEWTPRNADHDYCGKVSLRYGIVHSVNVITARLIQDVGPENVIDYARKMGVESDLKPVPSIALGTFDLSVAELTSAFTTFPNQGLHHDLVFISRIEDRNGAVLANFENEGRQAISEETAYTMVEMLRGVAKYGTAHEARSYGLPWHLDVGGKTGTTQNNSDGWFVGFTPHLVTGVWVGCADRSVNFGYSDLGRGSNMALPIWSHFMSDVYMDNTLNYNSKKTFVKPAGYNVEINCPDPPKRVKTDSTAVDSLELNRLLDSLNKSMNPPVDGSIETTDPNGSGVPKPPVSAEPALAPAPEGNEKLTKPDSAKNGKSRRRRNKPKTEPKTTN